jgi:hypothetical protein
MGRFSRRLMYCSVSLITFNNSGPTVAVAEADQHKGSFRQLCFSYRNTPPHAVSIGDGRWTVATLFIGPSIHCQLSPLICLMEAFWSCEGA